MSPSALKLLTMAYENYLASYDKNFSYQFRNADDLVQTVNGAQQLYEDGYIENASDSVFAHTVSIVPPEPVSFDITTTGIEYIRSNRKL